MEAPLGLPDVNVLLALAWPNHQFHAQAVQWFTGSRGKGWCTCAVTQLGFVRLSSNPNFTPHARPPREAAELLARLCADRRHRFIEKLPSLTAEPFTSITARLQGFSQLTDAFLVAVAIRHRLRLVTFDRRLLALSPRPDAITFLDGTPV